MRLSHLILPVVAAAVVATACSTSTQTAETNTSASPEACSFDESVSGVTAIQEAGQPPQLTIAQSAKPPTELVTRDLCEGIGVPVQVSDTLTFDYVGVGYKSREVFDTSFGKQPLTYPLQGLIPGWVEGMQGMKPGGARLLLIPSDLAYGPSPQPGGPIEPNEALAFIVELIEIQAPSGEPTLTPG